jgi:hypothetical protein
MSTIFVYGMRYGLKKKFVYTKLSQNHEKSHPWGRGYISVIQWLPSMCEALEGRGQG